MALHSRPTQPAERSEPRLSTADARALDQAVAAMKEALAHIGNQRETIARLRRQQDPAYIEEQALQALSVVTGRTVQTLREHGLGTLTARRVLGQGA